MPRVPITDKSEPAFKTIELRVAQFDYLENLLTRYGLRSDSDQSEIDMVVSIFEEMGLNVHES